MPDRHRHDEFIWALIFSLIINLLFIFALLAQRYGAKSPKLQPFVVSITMNQQPFPGEFPVIPGPTAIPAPAKRKKTLAPPVTLLPQHRSVNQMLPARGNEEEITPLTVTELAEAGTVTDLSPFTPAGENATAAIPQKTTDGLSIFGDKKVGDNYTAPEILVGEKPPYPKRAEHKGWGGTVLLNLSINANGEVEKVGIAKTSGYELLDQQARQSVGAWRFTPARRNGVAIAVTVQQPIIFRPTAPGKDQ